MAELSGNQAVDHMLFVKSRVAGPFASELLWFAFLARFGWSLYGKDAFASDDVCA